MPANAVEFVNLLKVAGICWEKKEKKERLQQPFVEKKEKKRMPVNAVEFVNLPGVAVKATISNIVWVGGGTSF